MHDKKLKCGKIKKVALVKKAPVFCGKFQTTLSCSLKDKYLEYELEQLKDKVDFQKQSKKRKIGGLLLLLFNLIVIVGIFVYHSTTNDNIHIIDLFNLNIAWIFLGAAVLMFLLCNLIEALKFYQLIKKGTGKKRFFTSLKAHLYGRYYDSITPFSAAGEPYQIYYFSSHGIKGDKATSIPLVKHIFNMLALTLIGVVVLILNIFVGFTANPLIILLSVISTIANVVLISLIVLLSVSKKVGPALVIKCLKLLNKLRIVKNYKVTFFKVCKFVKSYQKSLKQFTKSKLTSFIQIVLALITYIFQYAIVYFIYLAFLPAGGTPGVNFMTIFACMMICDLCASIFPLPGGTVGAELSFDSLFNSWFAPSVFTWAMLIWRILTYFSYIIIGGVLIACSYIKSLIIRKNNEFKEKRQNKKNKS